MDTNKCYLTDEQREELTKTVMHEGWAIAFNKLLKMTVDEKCLEVPPEKYRGQGYEGVFGKFKYKIGFEAFIKDVVNYITVSDHVTEYETTGTLYHSYATADEMYSEYAKTKSVVETKLDEAGYPLVKEPLINFDFTELRSSLSKLGKGDVWGSSVNDVIEYALYVLVNAEELGKKGECTYFSYGDWLAIYVPSYKDDDGEQIDAYLKLIYSLEESYNDY